MGTVSAVIVRANSTNLWPSNSFRYLDFTINNKNLKSLYIQIDRPYWYTQNSNEPSTDGEWDRQNTWATKTLKNVTSPGLTSLVVDFVSSSSQIDPPESYINTIASILVGEAEIRNPAFKSTTIQFRYGGSMGMSALAVDHEKPDPLTTELEPEPTSSQPLKRKILTVFRELGAEDRITWWSYYCKLFYCLSISDILTSWWTDLFIYTDISQPGLLDHSHSDRLDHSLIGLHTVEPVDRNALFICCEK